MAANLRPQPQFPPDPHWQLRPVVGDEDQRLPRTQYSGQQRPAAVDRFGVHGLEGLVEQQYGGCLDQGPAEEQQSLGARLEGGKGAVPQGQ